MKNSNDTIGNRTRDLPTCSTVPQPTAPPHTPIFRRNFHKNALCMRHLCPSVRLPLNQIMHLNIETDPLQFIQPNIQQFFFLIYILSFVDSQ